MASPYIWLQLEYSTTGFFEAGFRENFAPYKYVVDVLFIPPMIILAIGDLAKRRHLARCLSVEYLPSECGAVTLRPLGRHEQVLLVDCELYLSTLTTLGEGPAASCLQHKVQDIPGDIPSLIRQFSFKLYWQLLSPFSSTILLFLEDFDPVLGTEILANWICSSTSTPTVRPRLVLVHEEYSSAKARQFDDRLFTKVMDQLQWADATKSYTRDEVDMIC